MDGGIGALDMCRTCFPFISVTSKVIGAEGVVTNLKDGTLVAISRATDNTGKVIADTEDPLLATFKSFSAGRDPKVAPGTDQSNTVKYQ